MEPGEVCKFELGENDSGRMIIETIPCMKDSTCNDDGYCVCTRSWMYKNADGICVLKRQHSEDCDETNNACDSEEGLQCGGNGTCVCSEGAIYDSERETCSGLPDKACVGVKEACAHPSSDCLEGICSCAVGFGRCDRYMGFTCVLQNVGQCLDSYVAAAANR